MRSPLAKSARKYLLLCEGVSENMLDKHLTLWQSSKKNTKQDIYKSFLNHAKNRQSMPNTIGDIEKLSDILFSFNPKKVSDTYSSHIDLLEKIISLKINTPTPIDITNPKSHWVVFSKSIISSAKFLTNFKSPVAFHDFIESFYCNAHSRLALPLLLKEEIDGFGFALACDFLKENGYNGFVKPDTHLNDICRAAGITASLTDFGVFKDVISYCEGKNIIPYEFDKLIWLVGSGSFYLNKFIAKTNKQEFITSYMKCG